MKMWVKRVAQQNPAIYLLSMYKIDLCVIYVKDACGGRLRLMCLCRRGHTALHPSVNWEWSLNPVTARCARGCQPFDYHYYVDLFHWCVLEHVLNQLEYPVLRTYDENAEKYICTVCEAAVVGSGEENVLYLVQNVHNLNVHESEVGWSHITE